MSEWLSIESAPKGGGAERVDDPAWVEPPEILLRWPDGSRAIGRWDWYYAEGGRAFTDGIAWTSPIGGELLSEHFGGAPTMWMPLP